MDTGPKQRRIVNPRYKANIFSVLTFGWTLETFKLGYSRDINDSDLYAPLPEHRSDVLGDAMQRAWEHEVEKGVAADCKPSLWRVLFKVFGSELMLYGLILAAMEFIIRTSTFLSRLFTYYEREGNISFGEAVFFSCGVVFCSVANVMVQHPFMMGAVHIGMKMRVGVCSLIYRKALKVSIQAMSESGAGLVVNLMANDLMTIYLYRELGAAAAYGALIIIAVVPFQIFLGTQTAYYRKCTALKSDERVRLMKEIIVGMDVIKMYTWEEPFQKIIDTVRRQEAFYIKMTSYVRGVILSFLMFTSRFGIFVTMLLYVGYTTHITVESVFFLTCYYNIMKQTMTLYFPQAVGQIAEMNVAVQRIRDYLLSEECELAPKTQIETNSQEITRKKRVTIIDLFWFFDHHNRSSGFGKSTLLHMILGELPCARGSLQTTGSVSYASQEPWLFVGSVRQNILFGQPFVKSRYMEVCRVCALERDISLFPHGDKTVVGERGVALSGGQRARINLARAILSQQNRRAGNSPVTIHQIGRPNRNNGQMQDNRRWGEQELSLINVMADKVREVREEDEPGSDPGAVSVAQYSTMSFFKRHNWSMLLDASIADQKPEAEIQTKGRVKGSVYREYFLAGAACPFVVIVLLMFLLAQACASASDYWISRWSNAEDHLTGDATVDNLLWAESGLSRRQFVLIFGIITLATVTVAILRSFMFFSLCMRSSISPVFGHLTATVQGAATVRAFGAEALLAAEFDRHQDLHSAAWYLFITCSRAFGYFLDLICLLFIVCVTFGCLMKTDMDASSVGLAITQSISLTGIFQWGMRQSAEMENQMTSVERIGIVGRTGAGKSSIIQALFRLAYLEGTILIDGLDISTIGLHDLREKISIIPQEPVLFSGTMRKNLDPFDEFADEVLLTALDNVELRSEDEGTGTYRSEDEGTGLKKIGLIHKKSYALPGGAVSRELIRISDRVGSVEQYMLVCLARAIVRRDRLLLLDEATANVDARTDALIQAAIRGHFAACTILVLDAGRLMEFDHPHLLLQNRKGYFSKMVAETGAVMAPLLHNMAKESYIKMQQDE
ncbi:hypothetical protein MSG28_000538 [Choristoneura fumiferana]|uniref:Uncharacterized protein n=1 Tax=Choristoneura fumiferana TaxID=7141 RepID=A0ACC0K193_CHOFU|nr:hypothetical protein MSG28_000538 [Choristoneura fumiferana]